MQDLTSLLKEIHCGDTSIIRMHLPAGIRYYIAASGFNSMSHGLTLTSDSRKGSFSRTFYSILLSGDSLELNKVLKITFYDYESISRTFCLKMIITA